MNRFAQEQFENRNNDGDDKVQQKKRELRKNSFALFVTTSYLWGLLLMLLGLMFYWFWTR